jgi:GTP-binding protein HflX
VLGEIGAAEVPQIRVLNKADLAGLPPGVERDACGTISSVRVSASTGAGCAELRQALAERFPAAPAFDGHATGPSHPDVHPPTTDRTAD